MWKNVPFAHDVAFRGWSTRTSDTSPVRYAVLVARPSQSQSKTETIVAFRGMVHSGKI